MGVHFIGGRSQPLRVVGLSQALCEKMNKLIVEKLKSNFIGTEYELAISEMESITLKHVMANSQTNLDNTLSAILKLSKGNLNELGNLVEAAKKDFRDVVYWATLENKE